jgi:SAM-dependent methyltransferase
MVGDAAAARQDHHRFLAELTAAPDTRVLDLGCGDGATLGELMSRVGAGGWLLGIDRNPRALAAAATTLAGAPRWLLVRADLARPLPIATASVDRVLCHNTLEALADPAALLAEAHRVLRPGGLAVIGHSDFDTLVYAGADLALSRRLVHTYCDQQQPGWMDAVDGTIGRRLADIAGRAGLVVEDVQAAVVLGRRFLPGEIGWGYARNLADSLSGDGRATPAELERWLAGLQRLDDRGAFLFSVNDYAVICGRMPR